MTERWSLPNDSLYGSASTKSVKASGGVFTPVAVPPSLEQAVDVVGSTRGLEILGEYSPARALNHRLSRPPHFLEVR